MQEFTELVRTVRQNCHIADARFAGDNTLCVFLLKMREYYRWEHQLSFSSALSQKDVGSWLADREALWETLETEPFLPLPLADGPVDPFDSGTANRALLPQGYIYSGGYGLFHKPHFFIADLERVEKHDDCTVLISGHEHARDLTAPPAMMLDGTIYIRLESVRRYLWEKIEEAHWSKNNLAMERALAAHDFTDLNAGLDAMAEHESRTMILHERGEILAGRELGTGWETLLGRHGRSRAEFLLRAIRDIIADGLSTLPALIEAKNWPSLHFYFATYGGMRAEIYPQIKHAYRQAVDENTLAPLRDRLEADTPQWIALAERIVRELSAAGKDFDGRLDQLVQDCSTACN
ncbi:MAG: Sfum_1244 family protein [Pseudomonadota bacterium]